MTTGIGMLYAADNLLEALATANQLSAYSQMKNLFIVDGKVYERHSNGQQMVESGDLNKWFISRADHDMLMASKPSVATATPSNVQSGTTMEEENLATRVAKLEERFALITGMFKSFN